MKKLIILRVALLSTLFIFSISCYKDDFQQVGPNLLKDKITKLFGSTRVLILPGENEYQSIPADPKNPITSEKVYLGKMLFHETFFATNCKKQIGKSTYSCATCHHAEAGFQSGLKQGIGERGIGFGLIGEARIPNPLYETDSIDVQPIISPTILN